jgi:hypothetical protein
MRITLNNTYICVVYNEIDLEVGKTGESTLPTQIYIKYPVCQICTRRLDRCKGKTHQYGLGKICQTCYNINKGRCQPKIQITPQLPSVVPVPSTPRTKRPYDTLSTTQRWERRKQARLALKDIDIPVQALVSNVPPPAALIHLPKSVRDQIRTVQGLHIPCEQLMAQCKDILASTHGCETATFEYVMHIVNYLVKQ